MFLLVGLAGATASGTVNVVTVMWTNIGIPGDGPGGTGVNPGQQFASWCFDVLSEASTATGSLHWFITKTAAMGPQVIIPLSGTIYPGQSLTLVMMTNNCG